VAYDAVVITVINGINVSLTLAGANLNLGWTGGSPPYVVQWTQTWPGASWKDLVTTTGNSTDIPITNIAGYFRVKGQ
jgi:hypothetical protein